MAAKEPPFCPPTADPSAFLSLPNLLLLSVLNNGVLKLGLPVLTQVGAAITAPSLHLRPTRDLANPVRRVGRRPGPGLRRPACVQEYARSCVRADDGSGARAIQTPAITGPALPCPLARVAPRPNGAAVHATRAAQRQAAINLSHAAAYHIIYFSRHHICINNRICAYMHAWLRRCLSAMSAIIRATRRKYIMYRNLIHDV
ncbi:hypothetical protein DFH09DRAFT_1318347 [Mycena vulgaris]|nr:hypothetical protein DFH09DRAFT_1318347 [Mycena vulgaris]